MKRMSGISSLMGASLLLATFLIAGPSTDASAQSLTGRIGGRVNDSTAAFLGGAQVRATELESGRTWLAETDDRGAYLFPALPAGTYRVVVERVGFKSFVAEAVRVEMNQSIRLDLTLQLGSQSEAVEVRPANSAHQIDSAVVSFSMDRGHLEALPANGRNYLALTLIAPGFVTTNPSSFGNGQRTAGGGRPYVNGNRAEANSFLIEGIDNNQTTDNLVAYHPSVEAIDEIQLVTSNASADVGNYQGGIVSVGLKSGTNILRGSASAFVRDEALNATNWARKWQPRDPLNPRAKPELRYSVLGGTLGGPLVKNRLFFFGDYLRSQRGSGLATGVFSLIPAEMRRGDLSALLEGSSAQQLYDPLSSRPDPSGSGGVIRDPFPGNQIPFERIHPVALALFASGRYPHPSRPGLTDNAFATTNNALQNDQFDVKMSGRLSARDDFRATYIRGSQRVTDRSSQPLTLGVESQSPLQATAVHWTRQWSSNLLHESRAGFNRIGVRLDNGVDMQGIGRYAEEIGIFGANRRAPGLPAVVVGPYRVGSSKIVQDFSSTTVQYHGTFLWHSGAHVRKAGFGAIRYLQDVYFSGNNGQLGVVEFSGQYTRNLSDPQSLGSPLADFLLGYPTRMARGDFSPTWGHRATLVSGFFQDDWHATDELTVNLGLRYDYRTPFVEVEDRQANVDLTTGQLRFAGRDGNSRALYEPYKYDWQPRLGVAWNPTAWQQRIVLRGGYGISSFLEGTGTNLRLTMNPPFFNEFETINTNPAVLGASIDSGFDSLREKDPLTGSVLRAWDPRHRPARSHQWNVTAEWAVWRGVVLQGSYVGQFGTHLTVPVNANQRPGADAPRPFDGVYPQISGVILTTPNADMRYQGLQTLARKRLSSGWSFVASHTWSRAMSHSRGFYSHAGQAGEAASFWPNPRDREADWGPAPADVTQNVAVSWVWELPWGTGRRWVNRPSRIVRPLIDGWSMAGIWKAHSGFPITVFAPDQSRTGARSGRPNQIAVGNDQHQPGPTGSWFDTSVFVLPASGSFGDANVGSIRGPGLNVVDLALSKDVELRGRTSLQVRVEAFNLLNRPVFNAPDRSLTSPTFGKVLSSQLEREIQLGVRLRF